MMRNNLYLHAVTGPRGESRPRSLPFDAKAKLTYHLILKSSNHRVKIFFQKILPEFLWNALFIFGLKRFSEKICPFEIYFHKYFPPKLSGLYDQVLKERDAWNELCKSLKSFSPQPPSLLQKFGQSSQKT